VSEPAREVPLVELLESVPRNGRVMIEIDPMHHRNIPYGRFCHEAAQEIRSLRQQLEQARKNNDK